MERRKGSEGKGNSVTRKTKIDMCMFYSVGRDPSCLELQVNGQGYTG